jgi:hypothetical protein
VQMKVNSVSGITCHVENLAKAAEFYETIGFRRGKDESDRVEDFHKAALSKGLKPDGEPERQPSGNREFVLRDPDGYNLAFFQKK